MNSPLPFRTGCAACARLSAAEADARAKADLSLATDIRVKARRHLRTAHGVAEVPV